MVYLCQTLCPQRHCILAAASDTEEPKALERHLVAQVRDWLLFHVMNPWCGICGARQDTWTYEVSRTRYATMAEAESSLRAAEAAQVRSKALLQALGLAYDEAPGHQN